MTLRSWLRRRAPELSSRVREAREAVRSGDVEGALGLLRGRYGDALGVLQDNRQTPDIFKLTTPQYVLLYLNHALNRLG